MDTTHGSLSLLPYELLLQICDELQLTELVRLGSTQKCFDFALTAAFKYDAVHEQKAILAAVWKESDTNYAIKLLTTSLQYGADINKYYDATQYNGKATALHIAAAVGKLELVDKLLEHGADVKAKAYHVFAFLEAEDAREVYLEAHRKTGLDHDLYSLPHAVPFLMNDVEIVRKLVCYGAPVELYGPILPAGVNNRTCNIFHLLAAGIGDFSELYGLFKKHYGRSINNRSPHQAETAIVIAASDYSSQDDSVLNFLFSLNPDLNVTSIVGKTPLMQVVDAACFAPGLKKSQYVWFQNSILSLISHGANLNQFITGHAEPTIMFYILSLIEFEIESGRKLAWLLAKFVETFLDQGYNLSIRSAQNTTPLNYIISLLARYPDIRKFLPLFSLLLEHDVDFNTVSIGQTSNLLTAFIGSVFHVPLVEQLLVHGATIRDWEVDSLVDCLLEHPRRRVLGTPIVWKLKNGISQRCINTTYKTIMITDDIVSRKWFEQFQCTPSQLESTIARCFMQDGRTLASPNLDYDFYINWMTDEQDSFLHLLVKKLQQDAKYSCRKALIDMQFLIERGITVASMKLAFEQFLITIGLVAGVPVPEAPGIPSLSSARSQLNDLKVALSGSGDGYTRAKFPHWEPVDGKCDAREFALKRDGTGVQTKADCGVTSGSWKSPYDGATWTKPVDLDIDHMVPLKDAWVSGASSWTTAQRKSFANDVTRPQLWTVTNTINRSKGDRSPDSWKPPLKTFHCKYAESWVQVKSHYGLTATVAEKAALGQMLDSCAGTPSSANLYQLQRMPYFATVIMVAVAGLV